MADAGEAERYGRAAILFHWTIALLILVNWPLGLLGEAIEERLGASPVWLHKSIGLTVLALTLLRLAWRLANPPPPLPATVAGWRARAARLSHAGLYLLTIAVPLSGWLRVSPGRYPLEWFGFFALPKFPIERGSAQAELASASHEWLAFALAALVVLHVAAALHHHFRQRDAVLARMVPSLSLRAVEHGPRRAAVRP